MTTREFDNGQYWVQLSAHDEPEVARYDHGCWRLHGVQEPLETEDLDRIGRRVEVTEDAFKDEP